MLAVRLAKLKFIAEELVLARHLALHAPDSFDARTLARHILIRARDFIEHARGLRRPLNQAGFDTGAFHRTKEAYGTYFDEYFKVSRDRLGAHLQDFDFGKRLELWADIEISKINFFVDGAQEIYEGLAALNVPGYLPYADPPEFNDAALKEELLAFQRSKKDVSGVELGVDPLAMARDNTSASLNFTPVHSRAGQLALIRRWIGMQAELLERLKSYPRIAGLIKARIITDIVSFCDCLVTRSVSAGAPQEMDGLDRLVAAERQSAAPIIDLVAASHFDAELQMARRIRDSIGAHLEIDDSCTLESLVNDLNAYDLEEGLTFYKRALAAFIKLCYAVIFLRMYAADGRRIHGVLAGNSRAAPFSGEALPPAQRPPTPPANDDEAYHQNLGRWLDGDETQREEARYFFWTAFLGSDVIEPIEEVEDLGSGSRFWTRQYRKVHAFVASALVMDHLSDADFAGILELVLSCRSGDPYPLAELLVRQGEQLNEFRQSLICYSLGEIGSSPHASAIAFLETRRRTPSWGMRFPATLALFKTFIRSEGLLRINNKGRTPADYDAFVHDLTNSMSEPELLICLLAFASLLSGRQLNIFLKPFENGYKALQRRIEVLCLPYLKDNAAGDKARVLKQLIETYDYVGVALMVAVDLEGDPRVLLREGLLNCCCRGEVATAPHDQANRHLAMCFYLKKELGRALEIARDIADRNPDLVPAQILVAQILGDTPGAEDETKRTLDRIRRSYKLDTANEADLVHVEQEMTRRSAA
ncbi:hypothetical protein JJE66_28120 [Bradyrhizobium diazoefficiens]|uniref:hypothetical protein n=1 Tax=Bradyrhizobium diazoefficiens TaxID=1355477 RepID=UPI001909C6BB|nr:hypothetical protein [Bradyrhizobium diazoefficiens]MBK3665086.1 hypothetical protein [Bradyrhizobium diazoefficiens]